MFPYNETCTKNYFSKKSSTRQSLQKELSSNIQMLGKLKRSVSGFAEDTAETGAAKANMVMLADVFRDTKRPIIR